MAGARSTEKAVAQTASLHDAQAAAGSAAAVAREAGGPGTGDPLLGDLRRAGLLPLLVLHLLGSGTSYGNQLMERISTLTGGLISVNPNTMYPLLRTLEERNLIAGEWEHPERRSRRFYRLTDAGAVERARLAELLVPHLDRVSAAVDEVRREIVPGRRA
ncbi:MAG TPA: PadR family transcriptional regulator [Solirubrobacteraceae bacterium]|jgi:DNA-binding PadR family transcriptional regulator|nr:PadR family transcriptional regulator [Solirubrobacteraceae bacterium]